MLSSNWTSHIWTVVMFNQFIIVVNIARCPETPPKGKSQTAVPHCISRTRTSSFVHHPTVHFFMTPSSLPLPWPPVLP